MRVFHVAGILLRALIWFPGRIALLLLMLALGYRPRHAFEADLWRPGQFRNWVRCR